MICGNFEENRTGFAELPVQWLRNVKNANISGRLGCEII